MVELLTRARDNGQLAPDQDIETVVLNSRAVVYGLSRMYTDGHFRDWQSDGDPFAWMQRGLSAFISGLRTKTT